MLMMKLLIAVMVAVAAQRMFVLASVGRQLSRRPTDELLLAQHKSAGKCVGWVIFLTVLMIEGFVRTSKTPYAVSPSLFKFHLGVDLLFFLVGAAIVFKFTGQKNKRLHRRFAYSFIGLGLVSAVSGLWMLHLSPG